MMLSQIPPITQTTPIIVFVSDASMSTLDAVEAIQLLHTDYNLLPLQVNGLEHYVISADTEERFSIR